MVRGLLIGAAALALGALLHFGLALANPDSLWTIVHERCVPAQSQTQSPGECRLVDLHRRYAILKDLRGASHYLLLPTEQVPGIESPVILSQGAPNYWQAAWQARQYVEESVGRKLPREDLGLSINSARRRSQNQLHIHIDCVRPEVRDALKTQEALIPEGWSVEPMTISGHPYFARKIRAADLVSVEPFRLLASRLKSLLPTWRSTASLSSVRRSPTAPKGSICSIPYIPRAAPPATMYSIEAAGFSRACNPRQPPPTNGLLPADTYRSEGFSFCAVA